MAKVGRPSNRPTVYSEEIANEIINMMVNDGMSLKDISSLQHMPSLACIYRWRWANEEFDKCIARAREGISDHFFDKIGAIERQLEKDLTSDDPLVNSEMALSIQKQRIATLQWMASRVGPKNYGDKREMLVSGNANAPLKVETTNVLDVSTLSIAQLEALESALRQTVYALDAPKDDGVIEGEIVEQDEEDNP